jgi:hypothetical protein
VPRSTPAWLLDIVGGLHLLNGLGGKPAHAARFRAGSAALRAEGYRVAESQTWVQAFSGVPAQFLGVVRRCGYSVGHRGELASNDST